MSDSGPDQANIHALIVAAGSGERAGLGGPKQYRTVQGKPMLRHSTETLLDHPAINHVWIVIGAGQDELAMAALAGLSGYRLITGGASRQESVRNGLNAIEAAGGAGQVLVHDAARPFLKSAIIDRLLEALDRTDGAMPVLPVVDTIVRRNGDHAGDVEDRNRLWRAQTPQAFDFYKLLAAHQQWPANHMATDDTQIFRAAGNDVALVEGDEQLKKYTNPSDFEEEAQTVKSQIRTGMGYDVHQLVKGEELWLGGLKIEHDKGLAGHSDADVLLHALTDALLGAVGAGDIGDHFPPSDPQWRGAASEKFVDFAVSLIKQKGGIIQNVDMTVVCEAPKIKPHRDTMTANVARILGLPVDRVSVKATTTEGLGFAGRKEGIAAQAIATIKMEGR